MGRNLNWPEEKRREVAEYSEVHSVVEASKYYGIAKNTVMKYRKEFNIVSFSEALERDKIRAQQLRDQGLSHKAIGLQIGRCIEFVRNNTHGKAAPRDQDYTDEQKRVILAYVEKHSIKAAHRKFGPSASTISRWIHGKRKAEEDIGFYATSKARLHPAIAALRV